MPQAIPLAVRQALIERRQQGYSLNSLSQEFEISLMTVRSIWRRFRDRGGSGLRPDYPHCGRPGPRRDAELIQAACELKHAHPTWGAVFILIQLRPTWPNHPRPSERTLQRWFHVAGVNRPPRRRPPQDRRQGKTPHEVWQVDAVEKQCLAHGQLASWLTVTEEVSGAILTAEVSPPGALARGRPGGRAGDVAPDLPTLGTAAAPAGRQRTSLGLAQRLAA